jgi:hypothetical protein
VLEDRAVTGDDHYVERLKNELRWATLERDIYRDALREIARIATDRWARVRAEHALREAEAAL